MSLYNNSEFIDPKSTEQEQQIKNALRVAQEITIMAIQVNGANIDYSRLPEHVRGGFERWIEYGISPGNFGWAVIINDLFKAVAYADKINLARMKDIIMFFYRNAPNGCYGSVEKAKAWQKARREEY